MLECRVEGLPPMTSALQEILDYLLPRDKVFHFEVSPSPQGLWRLMLANNDMPFFDSLS